MNEKAPERLLELQRRFAGHLRDPDNVPPPEGIEDRRLAIYRRLFFNNLSNLFARNFPVIRKLTEDDDW
ncbi:MAG: DNA-binding domain-containing protein, partial [Pseudomonadota bacterium]